MIEVDVWVRGTAHASTSAIRSVRGDASSWTDVEVRALLVEMLSAIERASNPDGEPPSVSLRGFSWIVSPEAQGVLVHIEMRMGTASAGPFMIAEPALTAMIARVMATAGEPARVH